MGLLVHCAAQASALSTATAGPVDTTGATLIVCIVGNIAGVSAITCTDTNGSGSINTYTGLTEFVGSASRSMNIFYKYSPTTSTTHSFLGAGVNIGYPGIAVLVFSNTPTTPYVSESAGGTSGTATVQPGSITPSNANNLLVVGAYGDGANPQTIDSSFTKTDALATSAGTFESIAGAYLLQSSATAQNPTWTCNANAAAYLALMAEFKQNGAGATAGLFLPTPMTGLGAGGPFFPTPT